jgi:hypothetical protein
LRVALQGTERAEQYGFVGPDRDRVIIEPVTIDVQHAFSKVLGHPELDGCREDVETRDGALIQACNQVVLI